MTGWYWSALLAAFGVIGLYLAGRGSAWGWTLGLVDEVLWILYAIATGQWPFCLSALAYGWVYARNLHACRKKTHDPPLLVPTPNPQRVPQPCQGRAHP
jgi:hypothetical protein